MKIVGDILIIETSDPGELRRELNSVLGDEPLTAQGSGIPKSLNEDDTELG